MNRRRSVRFELQMPVICQWKDQQGRQYETGGFSRDIGAAGVFVLSSVSPREETDVTLKVLLPALGGTPSGGLQLQSEGKVVRIEAATGFAVCCEFERVEFERVDGVETKPGP